MTPSPIVPLLPLTAVTVLAQAPATPPAPALSPPAESSAIPLRRDITIDLRCISLPQDLAVPLVRGFRSPKAEERARALTTCDELLAKGVAKLHAWPVLTTHSDNRAVQEDFEAIMYANTFAPASTNLYSGNEQGVPIKATTETRAQELQPLATTFETRNVGVTLEVEPVARGEEKAIYLNVVARHVRLKSVDRVTIEHENVTEKRMERVIQEVPRFTEMSVTTSLTLWNGETKVIGVFKSPEGENQLELFILSAEAGEPR